jgi:catechol 2,3-dioxygenase-like lactoylglutathione lyase family enzyme
VSDLDRSIDFYRGLLGLELVDKGERDADFSARVTGIKGAHLKIAYLKASNCSLELVQYLRPEGIKIDTRTCNVGSSHVCFVVDDYHAVVAVLREKNVKFSGEVAVVPAGPNRGRAVLYFKDPDLNNIEVISNCVMEVTKRSSGGYYGQEA